LCGAEPIPAKLDRALRAKLTKAARRLETAEASEGRKLARLLRKARSALAAMDRKASAALEAERISLACEGEIGGIVGAIGAELP
jgi:hypothetical protein